MLQDLHQGLLAVEDWKRVLSVAHQLKGRGHLDGARAHLATAIQRSLRSKAASKRVRLELLACQLDVVCRMRWSAQSVSYEDDIYARALEREIASLLVLGAMPDELKTVGLWHAIAESTIAFKRFADARGYLRTTVELAERLWGDGDQRTVRARALLVDVLAEGQEWDEAVVLAERNYCMRQSVEPLAWYQFQIVRSLVIAYVRCGRIEDAKTALDRAWIETKHAPAEVRDEMQGQLTILRGSILSDPVE